MLDLPWHSDPEPTIPNGAPPMEPADVFRKFFDADAILREHDLEILEREFKRLWHFQAQDIHERRERLIALAAVSLAMAQRVR